MSTLSPAAQTLLADDSLSELLHAHGRAPVAPEAATVLAGRNLNLRVPLVDGTHVFVKQFVPPSDGDHRHSAENFTRACEFEEFRSRAGGLHALGAPDLVGYDTAHRLMVFEPVDDAVTMGDLADEGRLTAHHLYAAGRALATLHAATPTGVPTQAHRMPPVGGFAAIPLATWQHCSAAELETWRLLQQDTEVTSAVAALRSTEAVVDARPIHGDLRLDQILVAHDRIRVTDFEDFRAGDAGRDIGSLLGELVYRAVLSIVKDWDGAFTLDVSFTHEEIVARGAAELDAQLPLLAAFWEGYHDIRARDEQLQVRSTSWLGWHMFDRLLASSRDRNKLLSVHRAAAGIGRAILLQPASYAATLGMR